MYEAPRIQELGSIESLTLGNRVDYHDQDDTFNISVSWSGVKFTPPTGSR